MEASGGGDALKFYTFRIEAADMDKKTVFNLNFDSIVCLRVCVKTQIEL